MLLIFQRTVQAQPRLTYRPWKVFVLSIVLQALHLGGCCYLQKHKNLELSLQNTVLYSGNLRTAFHKEIKFNNFYYGDY